MRYDVRELTCACVSPRHARVALHECSIAWLAMLLYRLLACAYCTAAQTRRRPQMSRTRSGTVAVVAEAGRLALARIKKGDDASQDRESFTSPTHTQAAPI